MNKLFILRDDCNADSWYYLTNAPKTCKKIASIVDNRWRKAEEKGEWFDFFEGFLQECEKRKVKVKYISKKDIETYYY